VVVVVVVVVVCCVVTAFGERTIWFWIFIFKCVYVISKLVHTFEYTCMYMYFFWMFPARVVMFLWLCGRCMVWCVVSWCSRYRCESVSQYLLVLWFAVLRLINFPLYGAFPDVAGWSTDKWLKYMCLSIGLGYEYEWWYGKVRKEVIKRLWKEVVFGEANYSRFGIYTAMSAM
jgi:hypothetical protein